MEKDLLLKMLQENDSPKKQIKKSSGLLGMFKKKPEPQIKK